mgnify:CR=1 FL=1
MEEVWPFLARGAVETISIEREVVESMSEDVDIDLSVSRPLGAVASDGHETAHCTTSFLYSTVPRQN